MIYNARDAAISKRQLRSLVIFAATQPTVIYSAMVFFSPRVLFGRYVAREDVIPTRNAQKVNFVCMSVSTTFVTMSSLKDHRFLRGSLASLYSLPLGARFSSLVPPIAASSDCAVALFLRRRIHSNAYCSCCCCCSCVVWAIGVLPSGTSSVPYLSFSCSMLISACRTCSSSSLTALRSSYQTLRTSSLISGSSPFSSCRTALGRPIRTNVGVEA